jgi:hypothetical protein
MSKDAYDMFGHKDRGRFGDGEYASARGDDSVRSDLCDIMCALHHQTERAILVSIDGDESKAQWIPKSRCEVEEQSSFIRGKRKDGSSVGCKSVTVTLSQSLAKDKGLV